MKKGNITIEKSLMQNYFILQDDGNYKNSITLNKKDLENIYYLIKKMLKK